MPGRHPDDDVLADLAADVLPLAQAREVEAHVLECDRCASLLSDAEHVRNLLLADDAGPVPAEIWSRVEAALHAVGPADVRAAPTPPPAPVARVEADGSSGWDGPDPLDDPDAWSTAVQPAVRAPRSAGATAGALGALATSRRDARPERRRPSALLLGAAAAVVLLLAVGTVRLVQGHRDASTTAAFGGASSASPGRDAAAAAGSSAGARITRSGADYTKATLGAGARALIREATATAAQTPRASFAAPQRAVPAPAAPDSRATDITNPQRLAACLDALGASSDTVVAVDLARYQGREAAVLVLKTEGGYEVWVVERSCHPGDEGALAQTTLPG